MSFDHDAFRTAAPVGPLLALGSCAVLMFAGVNVSDVAPVARFVLRAICLVASMISDPRLPG